MFCICVRLLHVWSVCVSRCVEFCWIPTKVRLSCVLLLLIVIFVFCFRCFLQPIHTTLFRKPIRKKLLIYKLKFYFLMILPGQSFAKVQYKVTNRICSWNSLIVYLNMSRLNFNVMWANLFVLNWIFRFLNNSPIWFMLFGLFLDTKVWSLFLDTVQSGERCGCCLWNVCCI